MSNKSEEWNISYKQLGVIIASFSLGLIVALLISNTQTGSQTNFTTTELIGFVLSVILSGASIVLAISAIALGKVSEQSVIERSDESIRLQNEVFVKTTEALQRIEASTGVTEKRIEDIISGRVGDISHQVAEIASRHSKQSPKATKELEETIRRSLMQQIRRDDNNERAERIQKQKELEEKLESKYQETHDKVLLGVGNLDGVKINKVGHGTIGSEDGNVFDGLFEKQGNKYAVSTFRPDVSTATLQNFLTSIVEQGIKKEISKIFFVLFKDENSHEDAIKALEETRSLLKEEAGNKLNFLECTFDNFNVAIETIGNEL
ncbi:hypothetical protein L1D29_07465 [Shewanella insulae]|uniref:hypothetical protein n=1 Tax=Shewanella insulae TaxID=2681496 RepID=UPI001EFD4897|nr:hypothetical protein [Shewanella insulae]MCG9712651.1 hypothetical protein [Shewanella insulae]